MDNQAQQNDAGDKDVQGSGSGWSDQDKQEFVRDAVKIAKKQLDRMKHDQSLTTEDAAKRIKQVVDDIVRVVNDDPLPAPNDGPDPEPCGNCLTNFNNCRKTKPHSYCMPIYENCLDTCY